MTVTPQSVANFLRTWGSLAAIIVGAIPQTGLPTVVKSVLIGAGAVIQAIDHWQSPSAPNPPPTQNPPSQAAAG